MTILTLMAIGAFVGYLWDQAHPTASPPPPPPVWETVWANRSPEGIGIKPGPDGSFRLADGSVARYVTPAMTQVQIRRRVL